MKPKLSPLVLFLVLTLALTGCGSAANEEISAPPVIDSNSEDSQEKDTEPEGEQTEPEIPEGDSFIDGVLRTEEIVISITGSKVINPGDEGNLYSDVPVLAVYYDITNLGTSDGTVSPLTSFIFNFKAFQDNDPNRTNSLGQGGVPGDEFRDQQLEDIKPGGTLSHAVAYELDDLETPVELVAGLFNEIGRFTIELD